MQNKKQFPFRSKDSGCFVCTEGRKPTALQAEYEGMTAYINMYSIAIVSGVYYRLGYAINMRGVFLSKNKNTAPKKATEEQVKMFFKYFDTSDLMK